jgi:hypothetical protein
LNTVMIPVTVATIWVPMSGTKIAQLARHQTQDGDGGAHAQGAGQELRELSDAYAVRGPAEVDHEHRLPPGHRQSRDSAGADKPQHLRQAQDRSRRGSDPADHLN